MIWLEGDDDDKDVILEQIHPNEMLAAPLLNLTNIMESLIMKRNQNNTNNNTTNIDHVHTKLISYKQSAISYIILHYLANCMKSSHK